MRIPVTQFKARCLALLEHVRRTGETLTVTRRGVPLADVVSCRPGRSKKYAQDSLAGTVKVLGDIMAPVLPLDSWEVERSSPLARPVSARHRTRRRRRPSGA